MIKRSKLILSAVFFCWVSLSANAANEELTSDQIKVLKTGIFEVVTKKLEDKTQYKDEFPFDLIPFQLRNDKYHSLGTAFLIGENQFVSAAHVFGVEVNTLLAEGFSVRDTNGNIFKITNITKYSNYRDLVQFSVDGDTSSYHKFNTAKQYEAGDVVYAAGNALGEGVIFRKGILTSFTYEAINGKWKNIRYSAAASPGNSGGPLLNLAGEVVGIVTKKSNNENLNYAFPIKEFLSFSDTEAEFYNNQMAEVESLKRLRYSWKFKTKLPKNIMTLRSEASKNFYQRFVDARHEFETKYKNDLFPLQAKVMKYLKNQANDSMLSIIDKNANDEWLLFKVSDEREIKITEDQSLYFGKNSKIMGNYQFILEKPKTMKLSMFVKNDKNILDTFLTSVQWNRKIANTPVYITSYGEPSYKETYIDIYGRPWHMASWFDQYSNRAIMMYCLAIPKGVSCDLTETSVAWLQVQQEGYKDNLHRMMLSYSGKLSQWKEFLQLPKQYLPKQFASASLALTKQKLSFKLGEISADLSDMPFTENSKLYVATEIDPKNINALVIGSVNLTPNTNEDDLFYLSKYYNQGDNASDNYKDFWTKYSEQASPYNFKEINEGKLITKYMNLSANRKAGIYHDIDPNYGGYLVGCKIQSDKTVQQLNQTCDAFISGLH